MMSRFRRVASTFRGAAAASRGRRALRAGRLVEGRQFVRNALALLGCGEPVGIVIGVWFSQRIMALRDLSIAAAEGGDAHEATVAITEGVALWKKMNLHPSPKYAFVDDWLSWGDAYVTWLPVPSSCSIPRCWSWCR